MNFKSKYLLILTIISFLVSCKKNEINYSAIHYYPLNTYNQLYGYNLINDKFQFFGNLSKTRASVFFYDINSFQANQLDFEDTSLNKVLVYSKSDYNYYGTSQELDTSKKIKNVKLLKINDNGILIKSKIIKDTLDLLASSILNLFPYNVNNVFIENGKTGYKMVCFNPNLDTLWSVKLKTQTSFQKIILAFNKLNIFYKNSASLFVDEYSLDGKLLNQNSTELFNSPPSKISSKSSWNIRNVLSDENEFSILEYDQDSSAQLILRLSSFSNSFVLKDAKVFSHLSFNSNWSLGGTLGNMVLKNGIKYLIIKDRLYGFDQALKITFESEPISELNDFVYSSNGYTFFGLYLQETKNGFVMSVEATNPLKDNIGIYFFKLDEGGRILH